jgi:hypothetical protein
MAIVIASFTPAPPRMDIRRCEVCQRETGHRNGMCQKTHRGLEPCRTCDINTQHRADGTCMNHLMEWCSLCRQTTTHVRSPAYRNGRCVNWQHHVRQQP